jgi:hypothetical protein
MPARPVFTEPQLQSTIKSDLANYGKKVGLVIETNLDEFGNFIQINPESPANYAQQNNGSPKTSGPSEDLPAPRDQPPKEIEASELIDYLSV